MKMITDPVERDAILVGLRLLQARLTDLARGGPMPVRFLVDVEEITTNGDEHPMITAEQIDDLCQRLNAGEHP